MLLTKSKPRLSADSQINRILLIAEEKKQSCIHLSYLPCCYSTGKHILIRAFVFSRSNTNLILSLAGHFTINHYGKVQNVTGFVYGSDNIAQPRTFSAQLLNILHYYHTCAHTDHEPITNPQQT